MQKITAFPTGFLVILPNLTQLHPSFKLKKRFNGRTHGTRDLNSQLQRWIVLSGFQTNDRFSPDMHTECQLLLRHSRKLAVLFQITNKAVHGSRLPVQVISKSWSRHRAHRIPQSPEQKHRIPANPLPVQQKQKQKTEQCKQASHNTHSARFIFHKALICRLFIQQSPEKSGKKCEENKKQIIPSAPVLRQEAEEAQKNHAAHPGLDLKIAVCLFHFNFPLKVIYLYLSVINISLFH